MGGTRWEAGMDEEYASSLCADEVDLFNPRQSSLARLYQLDSQIRKH
jgi:hypothetical protein